MVIPGPAVLRPWLQGIAVEDEAVDPFAEGPISEGLHRARIHLPALRVVGGEEAKKGLSKAEAAHESEPENKEDKEASAKMAGLVAGMRAHIKVAEDAINPAQISAGKAVPPDTSASGQPGGEPVGGAPQGPTSLVGSNEAAQNYTKGQSQY